MAEVKLPSAVRRQEKEADEELERLKKLEEGNGPGGDGSGGPTLDTDGPPVETPGQAAGEELVIPQKDVDDEPVVIDWEAEAKALTVERDKAVAAYKTLNGKYKAEVPDVQAENKQLRDKVRDLEATPKTIATPEPLVVEGLDEKALREQYGDGMVDALIATKTQAREAAKAEFAPQLERLDALERRVGEGAEKTALNAEQGMFDKIAETHKDWEQIDDLASWHGFLAEIDPNTGEPHQAAIHRAHKRLDAGPIIRQLSAFKRRSKRGNAALEAQLVPGDAGRVEAPPPDADQTIYKQQDVDAFFKRLAINKSKGIPDTDETKRLDTLYTVASLENRVR